MAELQIIGRCREYIDMVVILRTEAQQQGIPYTVIDDIAGVADGLTQKILGAVPVKQLGFTTWGPVLTALGLEVCFVKSADAERIRARHDWRRDARSENKRKSHISYVDTLALKRRKTGHKAKGHPGKKHHNFGDTEWGRQMVARRWLLRQKIVEALR